MQLGEVRARIGSLSLSETTVESVKELQAGPFEVEQWGGLAPLIFELPDHFRVRLVVAPQITVEVWLPAGSWNQRFQGVGGAGLAGLISYGALSTALQGGYATASTDTGHVGNTDALWAIGRPDLVVDYAHRAIHQMTVKAKAVIEAVYGRPAERSYFVGCSTGGRQGLMEAQRYPDDYDGILAGAPAIDISTFHTMQVWAAQHALLDPRTYITQEQYAAINKFILDKWDAHDGAADGLLEDPRQVVVDFDGARAAAGLSDEQVDTLRALYQGPVNKAGESVHPGVMPGGETLWQPLVGGPQPFPIAPALYGHIVFEDPDWDWRTFDFDADVATAQDKLRDMMDALDPDLTAFKARGGKLIAYHGWSDSGIPPEGTRRYYDNVVRKMGGRAATESFARLFMLPGVGHCRGGTGPDNFDGLMALVDWVEHERAPERIVASQTVDGHVVRTRPLCPYPKVARWTGHGSLDDAANFECVEP